MISRRSLLAAASATAAGTLGLSACSGSGGSSSPDGSLNWTGVFHTPSTPEPDGPIARALKEHSGIDFSVNWIADANKEEKVNTILASGSLTDISGLNPLTMPYARDALGSGLFWDVEEHLADFENLAAIDPKVIDGGRLDGVLYGVPHEGILARYGVLVRKDWLDRLGLEVPHTIDELAVVAEAFTTGDPTGTGQQTVGILDRAESFLWGFPEFAGYFGAGAFFELSPEGKVVPSFTTDASKEAMEWYRNAYSKGWINQEFVTMQKTNQEQAIAQDKGGIVFTALFSAQTFANMADSINPDSDVEWALVNDMTYGDVPRRIVSDTGGGMGGLMSFSTEALPSVEDLRRGLGLIDSLLDPEALDLMTNGIEGTHYEKDAEGAISITDQALWEKEVQPYAGIRPSSSTWYPSTNPYSNLANEMMEENAQYAVVNISQPLDSPTYNSSWATIEKAVQDGWNKYVTGALDMAGFESVIEDQRRQGLDDVIAEYTESYEQTGG